MRLTLFWVKDLQLRQIKVNTQYSFIWLHFNQDTFCEQEKSSSETNLKFISKSNRNVFHQKIVFAAKFSQINHDNDCSLNCSATIRSQAALMLIGMETIDRYSNILLFLCFFRLTNAQAPFELHPMCARRFREVFAEISVFTAARSNAQKKRFISEASINFFTFRDLKTFPPPFPRCTAPASTFRCLFIDRIRWKLLLPFVLNPHTHADSCLSRQFPHTRFEANTEKKV